MVGIRSDATVIHMDHDQRSHETRIVAETIRAERAAKGLTQKGLAERAGIPVQTYMRYENGDRDIPAVQLMRVAAALGIPFSTFARRLQDRLDE